VGGLGIVFCEELGARASWVEDGDLFGMDVFYRLFVAAGWRWWWGIGFYLLIDYVSSVYSLYVYKRGHTMRKEGWIWDGKGIGGCGLCLMICCQ
jgi:hypothetical protein